MSGWWQILVIIFNKILAEARIVVDCLATSSGVWSPKRAHYASDFHQYIIALFTTYKDNSKTMNDHTRMTIVYCGWIFCKKFRTLFTLRSKFVWLQLFCKYSRRKGFLWCLEPVKTLHVLETSTKSRQEQLFQYENNTSVHIS